MDFANFTATDLMDQLLKFVPLSSLPLKLAILALAATGFYVVLIRTVRLVFEIVRPMRGYVMRFPNQGVQLALRLNRWHWERKHDPSAAVYFRHRKHGSIIQLSLMPTPPQSMTQRVNLQVAVERMRDIRGKNAIEQEIPILPLRSEAEGYYYQCTDRNVKPGEWAFVTSGALWQENTMVTFTFLSHNAHVIDSDEVIAALRSVDVTRFGSIPAELQAVMGHSSSP